STTSQRRRQPRRTRLRARNNDTAIVGSAPAKAGVEAKKSGLPASRARTRHEPERTCILSRRTAPKEELIRLALSPDAEVAPDVRARAPGRGAWIGVDRAELDEANRRGKLKPALQRAFKTADVKLLPDLGDRTAAALRQ